MLLDRILWDDFTSLIFKFTYNRVSSTTLSDNHLQDAHRDEAGFTGFVRIIPLGDSLIIFVVFICFLFLDLSLLSLGHHLHRLL